MVALGRFLASVALLLVGASGLRRQSSKPLIARNPLESDSVGSPEQYDVTPHKLVVKFTDSVKVRAPRSLSIAESHDDDCAKEIAKVVSDLAVTLSPVFDEIDPELDDLIHRAEVASGTQQPDVHGIFDVGLSVDDGLHLVKAAKRFDDLSCVEYVSIQEQTPAPPVLPHPGMQSVCHTSNPSDGSVPSFEDAQGYSRPDQLDADYLQALGANGAGIRYCDCEYGFVEDHVEFVGANITQLSPNTEMLFQGHGTASMGITLGRVGFGVKGLAYRADAYFSNEYRRRANSVRDAIVNSRPGDVVLLEMQMGSPYGPAELDQTVWSLVKSGVDAGVVIVAAAGNGQRNLDGSQDSGYRARGDSGAILVGAGTPSHTRASFSTYGNRVDVQAWGDWSVMTSGYNVCSGFSGSSDDNRGYTNGFSGTSSASAVVAGAVTLFQSWALRELGAPLAPGPLRQLLKATGRPQQGGNAQNIGPHLNLRAAVEASLGQPVPTPSPTPPVSCSDKNENCGYWAGLGYCSSSSQYYAYMRDNCCQSCGF